MSYIGTRPAPPSYTEHSYTYSLLNQVARRIPWLSIPGTRCELYRQLQEKVEHVRSGKYDANHN
jgi:hypothetical protein